MPNHVQNVLAVSYEDDHKLDLVPFLTAANKPILVRADHPSEQDRNDPNFIESLLPMPEHLRSDGVTHDPRSDEWFDWQRQQWGCKWGAYNQRIVEHNCGIYVCFETANQSAERAVRSIAEMFPLLDFHYDWAEFCNGWCGSLHIAKGRVVLGHRGTIAYPENAAKRYFDDDPEHEYGIEVEFIINGRYAHEKDGLWVNKC